MALRIKKRQERLGKFPIIDLDKLEIIASDLKYCGSYDSKEINNQTAKFHDDRHGKTCYVRFQDGEIFLKEKRD